jgi:hypothetical protein
LISSYVICANNRLSNLSKTSRNNHWTSKLQCQDFSVHFNKSSFNSTRDLYTAIWISGYNV